MMAPIILRADVFFPPLCVVFVPRNRPCIIGGIVVVSYPPCFWHIQVSQAAFMRSLSVFVGNYSFRPPNFPLRAKRLSYQHQIEQSIRVMLTHTAKPGDPNTLPWMLLIGSGKFWRRTSVFVLTRAQRN